MLPIYQAHSPFVLKHTTSLYTVEPLYKGTLKNNFLVSVPTLNQV